MTIETREFETRYFAIDDYSLVRIERIRGQFGWYDGFFETLDVTWWLESQDQRQPASHAEIEKRIVGLEDVEPVGLANYFAAANDLGDVVSENRRSYIDFAQMFGRENRDVYPRYANRLLFFTTMKAVAPHLFSDVELHDVTVDLRTLKVAKNVFWTGKTKDLTFKTNPQ